MKRCAKCDKDYDAAYDACPHCAATPFANTMDIIGKLLFIPLGLVVLYFVLNIIFR